jgi:hypothetical protein
MWTKRAESFLYWAKSYTGGRAPLMTTGIWFAVPLVSSHTHAATTMTTDEHFLKLLARACERAHRAKRTLDGRFPNARARKAHTRVVCARYRASQDCSGTKGNGS